MKVLKSSRTIPSTSTAYNTANTIRFYVFVCTVVKSENSDISLSFVVEYQLCSKHPMALCVNFFFDTYTISC